MQPTLERADDGVAQETDADEAAVQGTEEVGTVRDRGVVTGGVDEEIDDGEVGYDACPHEPVPAFRPVEKQVRPYRCGEGVDARGGTDEIRSPLPFVEALGRREADAPCDETVHVHRGRAGVAVHSFAHATDEEEGELVAKKVRDAGVREPACEDGPPYEGGVEV